jgi:CheY-like chemotaxis protein
MNEPPLYILLAEDDDMDVELMQRAFEDAEVGHELRVVQDGQAAIDFLSDLSHSANAPAPAVVLLDLKMPRRNGLEVLRWIKAQTGLRCIPVLILSSSGLMRDVEPAYADGAALYLVKPASITERADVARFLAEWLRLSVCPLAAQKGVNAAAAFMEAWLRLRPNPKPEGGA